MGHTYKKKTDLQMQVQHIKDSVRTAIKAKHDFFRRQEETLDRLSPPEKTQLRAAHEGRAADEINERLPGLVAEVEASEDPKKTQRHLTGQLFKEWEDMPIVVKEAHPYADLFPLLEGDDLANLAADIKKKGLQEPVIIYGEKILDGRNRANACDSLGIVPEYRRFLGDDSAALDFVISANINRRHLTTTERAVVAVEADAAYAAIAADAKARQESTRFGAGNGEGPKTPTAKTVEAVGEKFGVSGSTIQRAKAVKTKAPAVFEAIKRGDETVTSAYKKARVPPPGKSFDNGQVIDVAVVESGSETPKPTAKPDTHARFTEAAPGSIDADAYDLARSYWTAVLNIPRLVKEYTGPQASVLALQAFHAALAENWTTAGGGRFTFATNPEVPTDA